MAQQVKYEPSVDISALELDSIACYQTHGLVDTITCVPPFLLSVEVVEFYHNLKRSRDGSITTTVTLVKSTGEEVPFTFDVQSAVRSLFSLPHEGDSISFLTTAEVGEAMKRILIQGDVASTIYLRDINEAVKSPIKVLKATFIGMLGSRNQVSVPQQRLLTALLGDYLWNWEEAFLNILLEAAKAPKIRLGSKVSALIIHVAKDEDSSWPTQLDYTLALLSLKEKAPKERTPKKKAARKQAAAKTTTESYSSSEGSGSQQRPAITKPTPTPQPTTSHSSTPSPTKSSKWKIIPRSRGNGSSASPSPCSLSHTPLSTKAELTSVLASNPTKTELTSVSASGPTEVGLTPASASANPPHKDLSPITEEEGLEVEEEEEDEEEREDEEANSDCQVTGGADAHDVLF